jgi:hypothetical protein
MNYLLKCIRTTEAVTITSKQWTVEDAENYVSEYFVKNFFPTIYKYIMGVYKLYHFNRDDYMRMNDIIQEIGTF